MGKATIISGGTAGLYTVELDLGHQKKLTEIAALDKRITELEAQLLQINSKIIDSTAAIDSAQNAVNLAIIAYNDAFAANPNQDLKPYLDAITTKQLALQRLIEERRPLTADKGRLTAELGNARGRRGYLYSLDLKPKEQVWCADLTENGTGQVATIEIPGEPQITLLAPGAVAHTNADGQVLSRDVMRYDQAYLNAALLPGWQKWKPTYRVGTITNIVNDTCSVLLTPAKSSAINLDIDFKRLLLNVPIDYLDCNGAAFEDGDQVVVKFEGQNWNNPKVIGFVSNPKSCGGDFTCNGAVRFDDGYYFRGWSTNDNNQVIYYDPDTFGQLADYTATYTYASGSGPEVINLNCSGVQFGMTLFVRIPQSVHQKFIDAAPEDIEIRVNGYLLTQQDNGSWFGWNAEEYPPSSMPPEYGDDYFQADFFIDKVFEDWVISPCDEYITSFQVTRGVGMGTAFGGASISSPGGSPYMFGVSAPTALSAVFNQLNQYTLYIKINGQVLLNATVTARRQKTLVGVDPYFDCVYDEAFPEQNWTVSGTGIKVAPEVTWVVKT